jgi:hypothetical protein
MPLALNKAAKIQLNPINSRQIPFTVHPRAQAAEVFYTTMEKLGPICISWGYMEVLILYIYGSE